MLLLVLCYSSSYCLAFQPHSSVGVANRVGVAQQRTTATLFAAKDNKNKQGGVGSSGFRQERLNKLAELEDSRVETDKGFVLKAAGGFVAFLILLLGAAYAGGVLDHV